MTRIVLDLEPGADRDAIDIWAEWAAPLASASLADEADRNELMIRAEVVFYRDVVVSRFTTTHALRHLRNDDLADGTASSNILVQFQRGGRLHGLFQSRQLLIEPGGVVMIDLARSFDLELAPGEVIILSVPRKSLPLPLRNRDLHGSALRPEAGATRLFTEHLRGFMEEASTLTLREGQIAAGALLQFAEVALESSDVEANFDLSPGDQTLLDAAQAYVETHIGDTTLSVSHIAAALRLSRSALYRLFEETGGVGSYIRERRLVRSFEVIANRVSPHKTLGAIGFDHGFNSEAHFSRSFKKRFGLGPSAARKIAK